MKLKAIVVEVALGVKFVDRIDRITLDFDQGDQLFRSIRVPVTLFPHRPELGETLEFELVRYTQEDKP